MAKTKARPDEGKKLLESLDVVGWRFDCLRRAGYGITLALRIADDSEIDLHKACELRVQGASEVQAFRILF